jgi:hypothetical protein
VSYVQSTRRKKEEKEVFGFIIGSRATPVNALSQFSTSVECAVSSIYDLAFK